MLREGNDDGDSGVSAFADFLSEWDLAEEVHAEGVGSFAATVAAKEVLAGAVGSGEVAHVFDDAEDADVYFIEEGGAATGDIDGCGLGCGNDDGAADGGGLHEGEVGVSRARGQVNQEEVELAPVDGLEELVDGVGDHGAAPDDGGFIVDKEAHGHDFDAEIGEGDDFVVFEFRAVGDAHHERDGGAVDVAIEEAYTAILADELGKGAGEVGGEGAFADAAFAAGDGEDVANAIDFA